MLFFVLQSEELLPGSFHLQLVVEASWAQKISHGSESEGAWSWPYARRGIKYLSLVPPNEQVWRKDFFRWVQMQVLCPDTFGEHKNASRLDGISLKKRRLSRQVRIWGDGPAKLKDWVSLDATARRGIGSCRTFHRPDECSTRPFLDESRRRAVAQTRLASTKILQALSAFP